MNIKKTSFCSCFIFCLFFVLVSVIEAVDLVPIPNITQRVTDLTATLSSQEKLQTEQFLTKFEQSYGSQIIVVILPTTKPEPIEQYAIRLAEKIKVGRKKVNDGVIFLIAKDDRRQRLEVGYGLEGAITDIQSSNIIKNYITPFFKENQYQKGIMNGIYAITELIQNENLPPSKRKTSQPYARSSRKSGQNSFLFLAVFLGLIFLFLKKFTGTGVGGVLIVILGVVISYFVLSSIFKGLFAGLLAVLFASGNNRMGMGMGMGMLGGGGFGSGGFGGSGGGGFGGGGGGFGGGGSSGSW